MIKDLLSSYIYKSHGWAVAEQFDDTFDGGDFENQNYNALGDIQDTLRGIDRDVLSERSVSYLDEYLDRLDQYLNE